MVVVKAKPGEDSHKLISRFRKLVSQLGITDEAIERRFFTKPSEERAKEKQEMKRQRRSRKAGK